MKPTVQSPIGLPLLAIGLCAITSLAGGESPSTLETNVPNHDWVRRDQVLGISVDWNDKLGTAAGGIVYVDRIELGILETLMAEHFINPADRQNAAPTADQFLEFLRKHPAVFAHGYTVSPYREDYRISIDGIWAPLEVTDERTRRESLEFYAGAAEVDTDQRVYCWWD